MKNKNLYSCDPKIEEFVKMNLQTFQNMSREELCRYEIDTATAIFISLTPANKARIWHEKLDLLLDNEQLDPNAIQYITNLKSQINSNSYINPMTEQEKDVFVANMNSMKDALGWSDSLMAYYFMMPYYGELESPKVLSAFAFATPGGVEATDNKCTCSRSANYCTGYCRDFENCDKKSWGCGHFGLMGCDGKCVRRLVDPSPY